MAQNNDLAHQGFNLGVKVRGLREKRQLTVQDLAAKTGLTKSMLSEIENDEMVPPVATLLKLAKALGVGMAHFFRDESAVEKISVTRTAGRTRIKSRPHHLHAGEVNYIYEALETTKPDKHMEPLFVEFLPMEIGEMVFNSHDGEEFVFLLEGQMEFRTDDRVEILSPGDTLYFESDLNHSFRGLNHQSAKAIVVVWSKL